MKNIIKNLIIFIVSFLVIAGIFSTFSTPFSQQPKRITISDLAQRIADREVATITVKGNELNIKLKSGETLVSQKEPAESLSTQLINMGVAASTLREIEISIEDEKGLTFWLATIVPFLIPFLLIGLFIWFMMRQVQGANQRALMFGQASVRELKPQDQKDRVTFKDVAGNSEAKEELWEVVEFLKNQDKFSRLGAKIPKGVLLLGPPGVGKTLLARAVSGEANVPFFHISGSEFVEMFVGVGASRVRSLFVRAKKNAPCIVFIDELDAVGRHRGAGLGGSHDEREQTLNQILVEMDGFEPNIGIVVLAATNRPDVLDPALLRPGRFDRRVVLDLPDIKEREEILRIHARGKPLAKNVNLRKVAERTPGFSGADLANLLNEAGILAARRNLKEIGINEIFESIEKVMMGPERKSRVLSQREKVITAYHEAGHAVVAHVLPHTDPVHKISIISRGRAGGYTLKLPSQDKHLHTYSEFVEDLAVLLAGYAAEFEIFGEVTTGATSDLKRATQLARKLVTEYGMSKKLGPMTFGEREELIFLGREITEQRNYSEKIAELIDKEVSSFIQKAFRQARVIIRKMRPKLEQVKNRLLEKETVEGDEFLKIMGPRPQPA